MNVPPFPCKNALYTGQHVVLGLSILNLSIINMHVSDPDAILITFPLAVETSKDQTSHRFRPITS